MQLDGFGRGRVRERKTLTLSNVAISNAKCPSGFGLASAPGIKGPACAAGREVEFNGGIVVDGINVETERAFNRLSHLASAN